MSQLYYERGHYSAVMEVIEQALVDGHDDTSTFRTADRVLEALFDAGWWR